ncbi:hypothetical protein [Streptomyces bohaiensis]|uniref:Alpha/beta hydrolase n=1 Tax=Streptomyces bohaiensis TaxID=1431344 RepID=A0ABX1CEK1_9ACTN|nr:hypothetical protein [Streptomyces bohaiensis]NJQ15837.1 hypothetical protein [Streptomyces bohaiensis]
MSGRLPMAAPALFFALLLAGCAGTADEPSQATPDRPPPAGSPPPAAEPQPDLPDGWLESLREYADCLEDRGAEGVVVDESRGGLGLGALLPPEAVEACRHLNPVYQQGGAREVVPDGG